MRPAGVADDADCAVGAIDEASAEPTQGGSFA